MCGIWETLKACEPVWEHSVKPGVAWLQGQGVRDRGMASKGGLCGASKPF